MVPVANVHGRSQSEIDEALAHLGTARDGLNEAFVLDSTAKKEFTDSNKQLTCAADECKRTIDEALAYLGPAMGGLTEASMLDSTAQKAFTDCPAADESEAGIVQARPAANDAIAECLFCGNFDKSMAATTQRMREVFVVFDNARDTVDQCQTACVDATNHLLEAIVVYSKAMNKANDLQCLTASVAGGKNLMTAIGVYRTTANETKGLAMQRMEKSLDSLARSRAAMAAFVSDRNVGSLG